MKKVFGKESCQACIELKKELDAKKEVYEYYDLNTVEGLTEAALCGIIKQCKKSLPVVLPLIIDQEEEDPNEGYWQEEED